MGQKDILEKKLEDFCEVFADIVNVLLFKGEKKINSADIKESATKSAYKADGKYHSQDRDVAKYWEIDGKRITMFGLENQTEAEKYMPFRIVSYDGAEYRNQLSVIDGIKRRNEKLKKENPNATLEPIPEVYPVISMVLYFGTNRWNEPKTLKECVSYPDCLDPFVVDYPLHLFEIAYLPDETVAMFESDFKIVAQYFTQQRKKDEGNIEEIIFSPGDTIHVREVLELMDVMLGSDNGFSKVYNDLEERTNDMNEIFRAMKEAEYNKGWNECQYDLIMSLYQEGDISEAVAAKKLSLTTEQFLETYEEWLVSKHDPVPV